jgi:hypothetical protein
MSAINGDKARSNRERRKKIARRKRTRELLTREAVHSKPGDAASGARSKSVPA